MVRHILPAALALLALVGIGSPMAQFRRGGPARASSTRFSIPHGRPSRLIRFRICPSTGSKRTGMCTMTGRWTMTSGRLKLRPARRLLRWSGNWRARLAGP